MNHLIITFSILLSALFSNQFALALENNAPEALELNATSLERKRSGYQKYPVVQCPGIQTQYLELSKQLSKIQTNIAEKACPEKAQIQPELKLIGELVSGARREEYKAIMDKGLKEGGEVSEAEAQKLKKYVEDVITTTAALTGFTKNSACFKDDDEVKLTLTTLSSIISEVSGSLGAIAGPLGGKITLAGNITAGLVSSVNTIVKARETFCKGLGSIGFGTCEYSGVDEQAYVSTLCSYYQFKFDIDEITNPENRLLELGYLRRQTSKQIDILRGDCPECADIIREYGEAVNAVENKITDDVTFYVPPSPSASIGEPSQPGYKISKPLKNYTDEEFLTIFDEQINESQARYGDQIPRGRKTPAYYTVRTLKSDSWAAFEIGRVADETIEHDADVALAGDVTDKQEDIEKFLFEDEAPKYIKFTAKRAMDSAYPFISMVRKGFKKIAQIQAGATLLPDPNREYFQRPKHHPTHGPGPVATPHELLDYSMSEVADHIHDIFSYEYGNLSFLESVTGVLSDRKARQKSQKVKSYLSSFRVRVLKDLKAIKRYYAVFRDYCRLFEYGRLRFDGPVGEACTIGHEETLPTLKKMFQNIEGTVLGNYADEFIMAGYNQKEGGSLFSDINEPDRHYVKDWVSSLALIIREQNERAENKARIGAESAVLDFSLPGVFSATEEKAK